MKIFNLKRMTHLLMRHTISPAKKSIYLVLFIMQLIFPLHVFSFLPFLYTFVFSYAREYVLKESNGTLHIKVYSFPQYFMFMLFACGALGMILCYISNQRGDGKNFLSRFICLQWPTSMCIMLITGLLFGIIIGIAGAYFSTQLMAIGAEIKTNGGLLRFLLRQINKLNVIHRIAQGLNNLKKATAITNQINNLSHMLYLAVEITTLFSTCYYFLIISTQLSKIAHTKNSSPN